MLESEMLKVSSEQRDAVSGTLQQDKTGQDRYKQVPFNG